MASRTNRVGPRLEEHLLDQGLSPEQLGAKLGIAGRTVYRALHDESLSRFTKHVLAKELGREPWELWPPMPRKRIPGGQKVAA